MTSAVRTDNIGNPFTREGLDYTDLNATLKLLCPIGSIVAWAKTAHSADSGTTDATTAGKLVQSGQNFLTTVDVGMLVYNSTDATWTYVTAVDSNTTLSVNDDIFTTGEGYTIYKTPHLPTGWLECNGQTVSDSESPLNGEAVPSLNSGTKRFLRGSITSGTTGGADTVTLTTNEMPAHTHSIGSDTADGTNAFIRRGNAAAAAAIDSSSAGSGAAFSILNSYYEVVWIYKVK